MLHSRSRGGDVSICDEILVCQSEMGGTTESGCWGASHNRAEEKILGCSAGRRCGGIGVVASGGCQYTSASIAEGYWTALQYCGKHRQKIN